MIRTAATETNEDLAAVLIQRMGAPAALRRIEALSQSDRIDPFKAAAIRRHIERLAR